MCVTPNHSFARIPAMTTTTAHPRIHHVLAAVIAGVALVVLQLPGAAQSINVWGAPFGGSLDIGTDTPLPAAGQDFAPDYLSGNTTKVDVTGITLPTWQVRVWRNNWAPGGAAPLQVWVHRSDDGSAPGVVWDATTLQVTTAPQSLFHGTTHELDVDMQFEIRGLSVSIPPNNYTTTITFGLWEP